MTKRKRKRARTGRNAVVAGIVVMAIVVVAGLLIAFGGWKAIFAKLEHLRGAGDAPIAVSIGQIDPVNDGRDVRISGHLEIGSEPVDAQLGIRAKAAMLLRHVEMYQWRERCTGNDCRYDTLWSSLPIDSHKFRVPQGHENAKFPFNDAHFAATDVRIGAFVIDPALLLLQPSAMAYPIDAAQLPPNLAVTFNVADGVLYAGGEPAHPQVGTLRIAYRVVPL
ncbi:MAG TPA: TMEM43 family protein, partial [Rudaea sp.]|nr:TMEM43 family protein [Rudaea sp.]